MKNQDRILAIHNSNLFGIFIESGCAGALANNMQTVEGASKTVYVAESPYSKEYQHLVYKNKDFRSIGKQSAILFANKWIHEWAQGQHKGINFIYTSTFQIAQVGSGSTTHGWIAHVNLETMSRKIFHVTLPTWSREETLNIISGIGITILEGKITPPYVDIMEECAFTASKMGTFVFEKNQDLSGNLLESIVNRQDWEVPYICISKKTAVRIEEIMRDKKVIVIYKGSFNPAHNVHVEFAKVAEAMYREKPIFSISIDTFGKDRVDGESALQRAHALNELGYDVIILKDAYFSTLHHYVHGKFDAKPKVFMTGSDTFNRIITTTHTTLDAFKETFLQTKFLILNRPNAPLIKEVESFKDYVVIVVEPSIEISSTEIRALLAENKLDEVEKLVPTEIFKKLKK